VKGDEKQNGPEQTESKIKSLALAPVGQHQPDQGKGDRGIEQRHLKGRLKER